MKIIFTFFGLLLLIETVNTEVNAAMITATIPKTAILFSVLSTNQTPLLYVVSHCKSNQQLHRINYPGYLLNYQKRSKGIQYLVPQKEWKKNPLK